MNDKILLRSYDLDFPANLAKAKLNDQNIPAWILNKRDSSYLTFGKIELYVLATDTDKAKTLLGAED